MGLFNSIRLGSSGAGDYEVERSLRFHNSDNTRIQRAIGSTSNRRTFTYSFWIKRTVNSTEQYFFYNGPTSSTPYFDARFEQDSHELQIADYTGSSRPIQFITNRQFRDPNAWYHFVIAVDTTQSTESDRFKLYVNGVQETSFSTATYPSQDYDSSVNVSGHIQGWGTNQEGTSNDYDGYLAEVHFIDGLQLTPSSFAETDAITGEWKPKKYAGAYGTNGNHLTFSDNSNTTATTLGKDSSGNGNNFTPHNFSVAAGEGNDSLEDTPTNNFATMNPLVPSPSVTWANGNLDLAGSSSSEYNQTNTSTFGVSSGKWYVEVKYTNDGTTNTYVGICPITTSPTTNLTNNVTDGAVLRMDNTLFIEGSAPSSGTSISSGDTIGIALDMDNQKVWFSVQGTYLSSGNPATGANATFDGITAGETIAICARPLSGTLNFNFGQRPFAYTPPTGFKTLCSANLPNPSIAEGDKHFNTLVFTGNQSTNARTGLGFQPDFVVYKALNPESGHGETKFHDSVRGSTKGQGIVQYNTTDPPAEVTNSSYLTSFDSDGLTVGSDGVYNNYQTYNQTGRSYQALCWKGGGAASSNGNGSITSSVSANTTAGFSIVSYTGTGSSATVGHGLGVKPDVMIIKNRNSESHGFLVYHTKLGATKNLQLNLNNAEATASNKFNDTEPTSSVFTVNTSADGNQSGENLIAYCFSEVAGYSKFGSFTGNANNDGTFVFCGFKPAFLLIKRSSSGDSTPWIGYNNVRNPINLASNQMVWNTTQWENIDCDNCNLDFLSNGFKLRNSDGSFNGSGATHIFLAFAESPFKYSRAR